MRASNSSRLGSLLLLVCVLALLACSAPAPSAPAARPTAGAVPAAPAASGEASPPPAKLTVGYAAITALYVPLWIAQEARLFDKYGLEIELVYLPGNTGPQSLVSGQVPVLAVSGFAVAPSMIEGAEMVMISSAVHRQTAQIYGSPGVESPQALRGKRLGITRPGTLTHFGAVLGLREWGLRPDQDVALVSLSESANILTALLGGAVDAGVLTDPNSFVAGAQGYPVLADLADFPREYISAGIAATTTFAQQNRPLLLRFLKGYLEGTRRYYDDKPFAMEMLRKYARIDDPDVLEKTYTLYAERYYVKVPIPTVRGMQNILEDYAEVNPRAREVDAARLVDASFVQELQREGFFRTLGLE
jgi:NitT/TauT family transport system substrate-binding protein